VHAERAAAAEVETWRVLHTPFDSWGSNVLWQLCMCEFAVEHMDDSSLGAGTGPSHRQGGVSVPGLGIPGGGTPRRGDA